MSKLGIIMKKIKKTPGELLKEYSPDLPEKKAVKRMQRLAALITFFRRIKVSYDFDPEKMKDRQLLVLSQHPSKEDPLNLIKTVNFTTPNAIMGYQNILVPVLFRQFIRCGIIPKKLYIPDIEAAKNIIRLNKKGASFFVFSEGIQSMDGTAHLLDPGTVGLIKKINADTVICRAHGAYLARPRFGKYRHGHVEYHYELLFTKEETKELGEDEIYKRLVSKFRYNDFEWNKVKQYSYGLLRNNAKGLDRILFICPVCGKQFRLRMKGRKIVCDCGMCVKVDRKYNLIPAGNTRLPFERIDEWYRYEQKIVEDEVGREDFMLSYPADYLTLNKEKLVIGSCKKIGSGIIKLSRETFSYEGTKEGKNVSLSFNIAGIPSAPFVAGLGNEFFYENEYYEFLMTDDRRLSVKVLMAVEALHNMKDPARKKMQDEMDGNFNE